MGGSTSVVKNKNTVQQVKSPEPLKRIASPEPETLRCRKHFSNSVTHISEKSGELICLNCYQRRKNLKDESDCAEIEAYTRSLKFKQLETKTIDQLRNRKVVLEEELKFLDYHEKRSASKRREMVEELHTFVNTLVELVKHMEQDLGREVNKTLDEYMSRLKSHREYVQTWYNELLMVQKDFNKTKGANGNSALRLRSVLDAKRFIPSVKANAQSFTETSDFKLKLNKYLTLKEIVGRKKLSGDICLGEVFNESDLRECNNFEDLPTIHERDVNEETEASEDSPHPNSKLEIQHESTPHVSEDEVDEEKSDGRPGHETIHRVTETSEFDALNPKQNNTVNRVNQNDFIKVTIPEQNKTRMRHQFEKDKSLAGIPRSSSPIKSQSRSSSHIKSQNRRMSTPRSSTNSIISPVSVRTPSRIQLLPTRQAVKSVHGKIAVKTKTIRLLTDGETPNLTDSVILANGRIVLCDQRNERLVLLNSGLEKMDEIQLRGQPHNITESTNGNQKYNTIAVSIPDKNIIQFIWVVANKLEEPNLSINAKPKCRGLAYIDNNLLYTSRNDVVVVKAMDTAKPWKFDYSFREPVALHIDRENKTVYVCCIGLKSAGEVVRLNFEKENIEQVLSFKDVKHPVCCSRDSDNNLYICDIDPPRVHLVSSSGQYCRVVLHEEEGNIQHVNFFKGSDDFLVTEHNSEDVHMYRLR